MRQPSRDCGARATAELKFVNECLRRPLRSAPRDWLVLAGARRDASLHLLVSGLRDVEQAVALGRSADDVADVALDPEHRRGIAGGVVAKRRACRFRAPALEP